MFNLIYKIFGTPLGWVMWAITKITPNYGVALLIFTFITRVFMFPIAINQQKSSAKMGFIQPRLKDLQDKYKNDQTKLQEEMTKLYEEVGYNPTSGCLPLLIQFPILFGLIDVIYKPLTHILRFPTDLLNTAKELFTKLGGSVLTNPNLLELEITSSIKGNNAFYAALGTASIAAVNNLDYSFLGMNLMIKPEFSMITGIFSGLFNPVIFIPILSGVTSFLMSYISMRNTQSSQQDAMAGTMKGMMYTMPIMSVWIAFSVPAGVGLYWIYSNLFGIVQSLIVNRFYNQADLRAGMIEEQETRKADQKVLKKEERLVAQQVLLKDTGVEIEDGKILSQKEVDSLRLNAARKKMADKYGDSINDDK